MACVQPSVEKKPLKRPRLGPPDFYPQDAKQSEDDLTPDKLRQGYCYRTPLSNEYESAKQPKLEEKIDDLCSNPAKIIQSYHAIVAKKNEINALQDTKKKIFALRDVHANNNLRTKSSEMFKDLAGSKPLISLVKKFLYFNKREEIFCTLSEYNIPMCRAIWFIKMTNAYAIQQQETGKVKKKQATDPCSEWTSSLTLFLRQLLAKLTDLYSPSSQAALTAESNVALKQWQYCTKLARAMFEEGLLDKQEFLTWMLENFADKCRSPEEGTLKLILPLVMQHLDGILRSELLSRKLAHLCCKKLSNFYVDAGSPSPGPPSPTNQTQNAWYSEYINCPYHRTIVYSLNAIVQAILIECSTALVWNNMESNSESSKAFLCGSPLDVLPCFPSQLPIPQGPALDLIVDELKRYENEVKRRSIAVDSHWSFDKCEQSGLGNMVAFILNTIDALDRHNYDRSTDSKTLDTLYNRIFPSDCKELEEGGETTVVKLLCHWAVTGHRIGPHRSLVVVRLLEKRQNDIRQQMVADGEDDSRNSHYFQTALLEYLDTEAPVLEETSSKIAKVQFANLVLLYAEFIKAEIFSHDLYLRTLITRGDLTSTSYQVFASSTVNCHFNNTSSGISSTFAEVKKFDDNEFEDKEKREKLDIDKLLATIDRPTSSSMNSDYQSRIEKQPMSVGSSYPGSVDPQFPPSVDSQAHLQSTKASSSNMASNKLTVLSRHYYNVLHFPVPQDDQYKHECNQRQTLLFGCGSVRDIQKAIVKKITKEMNKLWHKKNSVECLVGGQLKIKRRINNATLKALSDKYRTLVYFDQYLIADNCADVCLEQIREFTSGQNSYLPNVENIDFFLSVYEAALNFSGLIEFIEALIAFLPKIENQLTVKGCSSAANYVLTVATCCVGYLTKYLSFLMFSNAELINIWKLLFDLMRSRLFSVNNPSAERCVYAFLFDVYNCCNYLRTECESSFTEIKSRAERCVCTEIKMSSTKFEFDAKFAYPYFEDPKREIDENLRNSLETSSAARYNFVVNSIAALVAARKNTEKIFELTRFCADVTALHTGLSSEWLDVLKALCCHKAGVKPDPKTELLPLPDVLMKLDFSDVFIHQSIAALLVTLVGRRCIRMEDFVFYIGMTTFFPFLKQSTVKPDAEATARLVLHWCSVLFLCVEGGDDVIGSLSSCCRLKGELYLVANVHALVPPQAILALLIMILIFGNRTEDSLGSESGHSSYDASAEFASKSAKTKKLGELTNDFLSSVCQQEWIKNNVLQLQPDELFTEVYFPMQEEGVVLGVGQNFALLTIERCRAQKMLHMISRSSAESDLVRDLEQCSSKKELTSKILQNLSVWNLDVSYLDLELLLKQAAPTSKSADKDRKDRDEESSLSELIARAAIDVFQYGDSSFLSSSPKKNNQRNYNQFKLSDIKSGWLVAPLISKLTPSVQGKVLKAAALVLENGQLSRKEKGSFQQCSSLLSQQPFLSLVLTCLRGQDDQREGLLNSLLKQLQDYVAQAKADKYQFCNRENFTEMREALQLRLSLVGGMFDTVCKGSSVENWALLLLQLLLYGVITIEFDRQLFYTCVDMLTILVHYCLIPDASPGGTDRTIEEWRRLHPNVIKKLKKEIGDRYVPALKCIHQLLPIPRQMVEVVACEPYGSQPSRSFNRSTPTTGPPTLDVSNRKGLQVTGKERISPWDLIEGYRGDNSGPRWSLFQAIKVDLQLDTVVNQLNRMVPHDHDHQFKRPPLPGESRPNPYLEPLQVQFDAAKLQNARKDDAMTPASHSGNEFSDQVLSPSSKTSAKAKKAAGSTRGGRKNSRAAPGVVYPNTVNMNLGIRMPPGSMTPGPSPMVAYAPNHQQQPLTPIIPTTPSSYMNQPGWPPMPNQQQMLSSPQTPVAGYPSRPYMAPIMQPHIPVTPSGRNALNARLRGRQPSGAQVIMQEQVQIARHSYPQHIMSKVNEQYPNPNVQTNLSMHMEQQRQQLVSDIMEQQNLRQPAHRHPGSAVEQHMDPMQQQQQQPMQTMPPAYGGQPVYPSGNARIQIMSRQQQQSYQTGGGVGYTNAPNSGQNFNSQYFTNATAGSQMRMQAQNDLMVATPRYSQQPVGASQMNYNMVAQQQQQSVARSGNFMLQQQQQQQQQQPLQQMAMSHQQQQQMSMAAHQQSNQQAYAAGAQQQYQTSQQSGQVYPLQRMPSYGNIPMDSSAPMNYYSQQQQY